MYWGGVLRIVLVNRVHDQNSLEITATVIPVGVSLPTVLGGSTPSIAKLRRNGSIDLGFLPLIPVKQVC